MAEKQSKEYGTLIDRTLRMIKLNFIQGFKEAGVDLTPEQWVIIDRLYHQNGISQTELANGSFKKCSDGLPDYRFIEFKRYGRTSTI